MPNNVIIFKKIKFYNWNFKNLLKKIDKGGYLVAPAASALINISSNKKYYKALLNSDVAILDSGFFCILLRFFRNIEVKKFSGYLFLKKFLDLKFKENISFMLIDPSKADAKVNKLYLKKKKIKNITSYVAPFYSYKNISDIRLIKLIRKKKPRYIIINLGGEIQESLALYIKKKINFKSSIICTGAAIAFLTKRQAPINEFIDKYYLGWFMRVVYNPKKNLTRMLKSLFLIKYFIFR
tara:strand:+ start:250 stop:963 length:714 start_codon:yes stop_codon:yes gene_type:complete